MSLDPELLEEFKQSLADRYEAVELCELLNLSIWDLLEADTLQEKIIEHKYR